MAACVLLRRLHLICIVCVVRRFCCLIALYEFCRRQLVGNSETGKLSKCMQQKVWFIDRLTLSYKCMQHSGCLYVASMPAIDMHYIICCPTCPAVSDGGPIVTLSLFSGAYFGRCWMASWGEAGQLESIHAHCETVHWETLHGETLHCLFSISSMPAFELIWIVCLLLWLQIRIEGYISLQHTDAPQYTWTPMHVIVR